MNYSIRLPDPDGPFEDEAGVKYKFIDPFWRRMEHRDGYLLMIEDRWIAQCHKGFHGKGWIILPNPYKAFPLPIVNDGNPFNDEIFRRINNWVGPFVDRHSAMEYALWTLGYIEKG